MSQKLLYLISFVLVFALAGTNVVFGDTVWEGRIVDTQDAVEQSDPGPSGSMDFGSSDLEFMSDGGIQTIGLRFVNVRVPAGATITNAYVELTRDESEADAPVHIIIQGELTPDAPAFASTPGNISTRPTTTAVAKWSPEHWPTNGQAHQTSDISAVIEEVIGQPGWSVGNALVLIFNQDPDNPSQSHRTAEKAADQAPLLHIEFTRGYAAGPNPAHGQIDVPRDVVLSWRPGIYAAPTNGHKVYLSENFDDVKNGVGPVTQSATSYAPPQRLDFSATYYWRVDEVNVPPDYTVRQGNIWSFTTELFAYPVDGNNITAAASSTGQPGMGPENTINGLGLDANDLHSTEAMDMWLSGDEPNGAWIEYELDKVYKLHEMWVWNSNQMVESFAGFGLKDVTIEYSTNGTDYPTLGTTHEFVRAPGEVDYAHNTTVDFGGAPAKYVRLTANSNWGGILDKYGLSEVRFFHIPVHATKPSPDSEATDVDVDVVLGWTAGREADTHEVYFSSDEQAVIDNTAPVATVTDASYRPLSLELDKSYYWKINEVNEAETPTAWESDLWSFTTIDHLVVDDFEDYNDYPPDEIWSTWVDGYGVSANGATVGYPEPDWGADEHYVETATVHGGEQAMPFFYSNTDGAAYSEGECTFAVPQDWTKADVQTFVLYFHGTIGNTGQLYVKVNGSKVVYPGDAGDIAKLRWKQWNIDLASLGVNLLNITTLAIGIDGSGASGTLYLDDIRLYRLAPEIVVSSEEIWIEAEAADTITAPMLIYDDPLASGGKYIGTTDDVGNSSDSPPPDGIATYNFTVQGGTYKVGCRIIIPSGDSFWVRIPGAANLTPGEDPDNPGTGWVRWSDPPDSDSWYWHDVFSGDHAGETANWTLAAGTHTLEIARREDGALLDIIVISKID